MEGLEELTAHELIAKRDSIEEELKAQLAVLEQEGGVGLKGALIDSEGYPRADIDIYAVRTARHKVACLRNDHKAVMKLVEQKIHELHAKERERRQSTDVLPSNQPVVTSQWFAKVNEVTPGSPAAMAGLLVGDLISEFGSIKKDNFKNLQDIASIVQHSQNSAVRVVVVRRDLTTALSLRPQQWAGRGLLGCSIVPT